MQAGRQAPRNMAQTQRFLSCADSLPGDRQPSPGVAPELAFPVLISLVEDRHQLCSAKALKKISSRVLRRGRRDRTCSPVRAAVSHRTAELDPSGI